MWGDVEGRIDLRDEGGEVMSRGDDECGACFEDTYSGRCGGTAGVGERIVKRFQASFLCLFGTTSVSRYLLHSSGCTMLQQIDHVKASHPAWGLCRCTM